jgi:hypothetical protein
MAEAGESNPQGRIGLIRQAFILYRQPFVKLPVFLLLDT